MDIQLSAQQQAVVDCNEPRIVVKACPGSGKTFSVAARMAKLLRENSLSRHQGIAAISFTNTACDTIKDELQKTFGIPNVPYPSFIGTIDRFINTYIFLPYAHLVMQCDSRPEIIGTEFNKWFDYDSSQRGYDRKIIDPNYFIDKVSFNLKGEPIPLVPAQEFNFSWSKIRKTNGQYRKNISDIIAAKQTHFAQGKANQADANYFAFKILTEYPIIAQNITRRFPILIIDEAQDTTELQMAIIDIFSQYKAKSIMLIGDPDQAIFEWNTANPSLFIEKYNNPNWYSLDLSENRRSSEKICKLANQFSGNTMISIAQDKLYKEPPLLLEYTNSESVNHITNEFIAKCKKIGLNESEYAVVFRGQTFGAKHFNLVKKIEQNNPWINRRYYVRDIVHGKYLIDQGQYADGLALIEKGCYKGNMKVNYVSGSSIRKKIAEIGFRCHRKRMLELVEKLPSTDKTLLEWITELHQRGIDLRVSSKNANVDIDSLFSSPNQQYRPYLHTIHSVKGKTLEAILVFLTQKGNHESYVNMLNDPKKNNIQSNEELRIVYVAFTRPKKILWIAVPHDNIGCWENKLAIKKGKVEK